MEIAELKYHKTHVLKELLMIFYLKICLTNWFLLEHAIPVLHRKFAGLDRFLTRRADFNLKPCKEIGPDIFIKLTNTYAICHYVNIVHIVFVSHMSINP